MKKLIALVLALVMVLMVGASFAEGTTGSVTISSPSDGDTGSTYTLWKLFDIVELGTNASGTAAYVYTPVSAYKASIISAVNTVTGTTTLTNESTNAEIQTAVANITSEANKKTFADTLYGLVSAIDSDGDLQIVANSGSISGTNASVPIGYYVIGETTIGAYDGGEGVATRPMLYTVTTSGLTPTAKESYPTPSKTVTASEDGSVEDADSATAQIGKDVTFVLKTTLPSNFDDYNNGYKLIFTDTLSAGLKYKETTSITVNGEDALTTGDGSYTFNNPNPAWTDGSSTTLTWTWTDISKDSHAAASTDVIITYKATVTGDAVIGSAGNPNTLQITYSNDPTSNGDGDSKTIEVKVYAFAIQVDKKNDSGAGLAGAEFVLKKGDNYYKYTEGATDDADAVSWVDSEANATVLVSKADGTMYLKGDTNQAAATFKGLPEGTYVLHETVAPSGYNVAEDVSVVITAASTNDNTITVSCTGATLDSSTYVATTQVIDRQGATLPSTGGIGTTIFYIVGGLLVIGAAVILVARRKAHE